MSWVGLPARAAAPMAGRQAHASINASGPGRCCQPSATTATAAAVGGDCASPAAYVYSGPGAGARSVLSTLHSLKHALLPTVEVATLDTSALLAGAWRHNCLLLVMPGGADLPYCKHLNGHGNALIREYVEGGGAYLGLCAGAYYACARVEFEPGTRLEVVGARELAFFPGTAAGSIYPGFCYQSEDGAVAAPLLFLDLGPGSGGGGGGGGGGYQSEDGAAAAPLRFFDLDPGSGGGGGGGGGGYQSEDGAAAAPLHFLDLDPGTGGGGGGCRTGTGSRGAAGPDTDALAATRHAPQRAERVEQAQRAGLAAPALPAGTARGQHEGAWRECVDYVNGGPAFVLSDAAVQHAALDPQRQPQPAAMQAQQQPSQQQQQQQTGNPRQQLPQPQQDIGNPQEQQQQQQQRAIRVLATYPQHDQAVAALVCHVGSSGGTAVLCGSHPELHPSWLGGVPPWAGDGGTAACGGGGDGGMCDSSSSQQVGREFLAAGLKAVKGSGATTDRQATGPQVLTDQLPRHTPPPPLSEQQDAAAAAHVRQLQAALLAGQQQRWRFWRSLLVAAGLQPWLQPLGDASEVH